MHYQTDHIDQLRGYNSHRNSPMVSRLINPLISPKHQTFEDHPLENSQILRHEIIRSDVIKQKHQREINQLLNYENLVKQQREHNEVKLLNIFSKQKQLEDKHIKQQALVNWIRLQKDKKQLQKQQLQLEEGKANQRRFYSSQQQELMLKDQMERDREIQSQLMELRKKIRDDSYKGYNILQSFNGETTPTRINDQQQSKWESLDQQQKVKYQRLVEAQQRISQHIDDILRSHLSEEESQSKILNLQKKLYKAQKMKQALLDNTISKSKMHDQHVSHVRQQNREITTEQQAYYSAKANLIEDKIRQAQDQQKNNLQYQKELELMKEQHRNLVKQNSEIIAKLRTDEVSNHHSSKVMRNEHVKQQRSLIVKQRNQLLDQLEEKRRQMHKQLEHDRYPLLNSKDYSDLLNDSMSKRPL